MTPVFQTATYGTTTVHLTIPNSSYPICGGSKLDCVKFKRGLHGSRATCKKCLAALASSNGRMAP